MKKILKKLEKDFLLHTNSIIESVDQEFWLVRECKTVINFMEHWRSNSEDNWY